VSRSNPRAFHHCGAVYQSSTIELQTASTYDPRFKERNKLTTAHSKAASIALAQGVGFCGLFDAFIRFDSIRLQFNSQVFVLYGNLENEKLV
jgi:hypothetical protein